MRSVGAFPFPRRHKPLPVLTFERYLSQYRCQRCTGTSYEVEDAIDVAGGLRQPENVAASLSVPERLLLFCIASHTDWQQAGVTGRTVTGMMVRGLVERNAGGRLSLTNEGREVLAALLLGGIPSR